ncbi:16521_t:CDS:1, partial [Racocetra fulgida]
VLMLILKYNNGKIKKKYDLQRSDKFFEIYNCYKTESVDFLLLDDIN